MTDGKGLLSDELLYEVQEAARAQNRQPEEVVTDAVRRYLDEQSWLQFVDRNEQGARANGIGEADVERLISEVRRENEKHGR